MLASACVRDEIWVLYAGRNPVILSAQNDSLHILRGVSYVHGIMDGKAIILEECHKVTLT